MGIFLETFGAGDPVVLLHGTPTAPEHMRPLAKRLAARWQALLVHLPGYGQSPALDEPYELARSYDLLEDELAMRNIAAAHYVGFSGGTYRSFALALRKRTAARSIFALGAVFEPIPQLAAWGPILRDPAQSLPSLAPMFLSRKGLVNPAWVAEVETWGKAIAPRDLASELDALATAPDLGPDIRRLDMPITLRVGTEDAATPVAMTERLASLVPHARVQIVEDAGHALLTEDFEATAAAIEAHLGG